MWVVTQKYVGSFSTKLISIHTTRVGGDTIILYEIDLGRLFQSTPPVWVVTLKIERVANYLWISIHTTRVGGDATV